MRQRILDAAIEAMCWACALIVVAYAVVGTIATVRGCQHIEPGLAAMGAGR